MSESSTVFEGEELSGGSTPSTSPGEAKAIAGKSPFRLAMMRLRKDKLTMASLIVVVLVVLAAVAAPVLVKMGVLDPFKFHQDLLDANALPVGGWSGASGDHLLGVEPGTGRDAMSRFWYGITFSLIIALVAATLSVIIGAVIGIIAGFSGGWVDAILSRITDLTLSFPSTLMLLALSSLGLKLVQQVTGLPNGPLAQGIYCTVVLAIFGWTSTARVVRGQVLSIKQREFVEAAVVLGASRSRIYFKEILPNLWAPLLVLVTLMMPAYISAEAALSYLQVSVKPPTPTLGNVLYDSLKYAQTDPFYFFMPAILIATIVISFNLLGDGLRDALDPKGDR
ncbi:peptide/nickel transport system permease protein [Nocardioides albertanoniae]|uniref:Peptide/nickel transport system permease protein n=1 Tax=Nocardioides albertanoniae TaxID=1175486 RepID=A0A543A6R2_9ACTN|nr:ABC transporter permease [Nocardioides albertanoniae]TQL68292.1 peptide/nickel transport system permease protein [Nocardioides albertanoniae]